MDNQQATKNWFIGFMEGEGTFIQERLHVSGYKQQCQVRVSNKEMDLMLACQQVLSKAAILSYILTSKYQLHELYISGTQDCKILYAFVQDAMQCRLHELQNILGASTTTRETSCDQEWLHGIYEAEGCFTISTQSHKGGNISHKPEIIIENTNRMIIDKIVKTLYSLGLSWYIRDKIPMNPKYKPSQVVSVVGCKRVARFLAINANWIGRKTQRKAKFLNEYCQSRLSKGAKEPYTIREHQLAHEIKMKI